MPGWYYSVGGRAAEGPVTEEFITQSLKAGRFTLVDLVFREGDTGWCTIGEIEQFRAAVSTDSLGSPSSHGLSSANPDDGWVILKRSENGFLQVGPYTANFVRDALARGEVLYSEHAWKPGFSRWVRIGELLDFDRRRIDRELDASVQLIPLPSGSPVTPIGDSATSVTEMIVSPAASASTSQKTVDKTPNETGSKTSPENGSKTPDKKSDSHAEIEIEDFDTGLMRLDRPAPIVHKEVAPAESDGRDLLKFNEHDAREAIFGNSASDDAPHGFDEVTQPSYNVEPPGVSDELTGDLNLALSRNRLIDDADGTDPGVALKPPVEPSSVSKPRSQSQSHATAVKKASLPSSTQPPPLQRHTTAPPPLSRTSSGSPSTVAIKNSNSVTHHPLKSTQAATRTTSGSTTAQVPSNDDMEDDPGAHLSREQSVGESSAPPTEKPTVQIFQEEKTIVMSPRIQGQASPPLGERGSSLLPPLSFGELPPEFAKLKRVNELFKKANDMAAATEAERDAKRSLEKPSAHDRPPKPLPDTTLADQKIADAHPPALQSSFDPPSQHSLGSSHGREDIPAYTNSDIYDEAVDGDDLQGANALRLNALGKPLVIAGTTSLTLKMKLIRLFAAGVVVGILVLAGLKIYALRLARQNARIEAKTNSTGQAVTTGNGHVPGVVKFAPSESKAPLEGAPPGVGSTGAVPVPNEGPLAITEKRSHLPGSDLNSSLESDPNLGGVQTSETGLDAGVGNSLGARGVKPELAANQSGKLKNPKDKLGAHENPSLQLSPFRIGGPSSVKIVGPGTGPATSLEIVGLKLSSPQPLLLIQTNAAVGEKISVHIRARSGDVLKIPSFDRNYLLTRIAGEGPGLDLAKLNLGAGLYHIDATAGELHKSTQFFVGLKDSKFSTELEHHLKEIAYQQQREKKMMYYAAKHFEALALELNNHFASDKNQPSQWRVFIGDWRREVAVAKAPVLGFLGSVAKNEMAYPEEMKNLGSMIKQLAMQAQDLDSVISQKREVASQNPAAIAREFTRIKQEVAMISSRR